MPARKRNRQPKTTTTTRAPRLRHFASAHDIPALVDEIFSPERTRPLLLVSKASDTKQPRVVVESLSAAVGENSDIAIIDVGTPAWEFSHRVPEGFLTYGGSVRLCWPYATREDDTRRHDLFLTHTEADSPRTISRIRYALRERGFVHEPALAAVAPLAESGQEDAEEDTTLREAEAENRRLRSELATASARINALSSEAVSLRKTVHGLMDQVADLSQQVHHTNLFKDPGTQLRHEIETEWLLSLTEADRQDHPLTEYTFGPDFLRSIDTIEGVDRAKIVSTCVDVLTRRAWKINGRNARQMRYNSGPNAGQLTRADGATAWRCNLQTGTASARRLMWWETPESSIELAVVALHDDIEMR